LERADRAVRDAFFRDALDVASVAIQNDIAAQIGISEGAWREARDCGRAYAELAFDLDLARQHAVTVSPTLLFNEGRQRLNGNVGFRIIEANVRELLRTPDHEASWC
jgi:predicted DsbA family dithiol-disulfide isomerase